MFVGRPAPTGQSSPNFIIKSSRSLAAWDIWPEAPITASSKAALALKPVSSIPHFPNPPSFPPLAKSGWGDFIGLPLTKLWLAKGKPLASAKDRFVNGLHGPNPQRWQVLSGFLKRGLYLSSNIKSHLLKLKMSGNGLWTDFFCIVFGIKVY